MWLFFASACTWRLGLTKSHRDNQASSRTSYSLSGGALRCVDVGAATGGVGGDSGETDSESSRPSSARDVCGGFFGDRREGHLRCSSEEVLFAASGTPDLFARSFEVCRSGPFKNGICDDREWFASRTGCSAVLVISKKYMFNIINTFVFLECRVFSMICSSWSLRKGLFSKTCGDFINHYRISVIWSLRKGLFSKTCGDFINQYRQIFVVRFREVLMFLFQKMRDLKKWSKCRDCSSSLVIFKF